MLICRMHTQGSRVTVSKKVHEVYSWTFILFINLQYQKNGYKKSFIDLMIHIPNVIFIKIQREKIIFNN